MTAQPRHHAFTLVELLVVVSIIALLLSLALPSLSHARQAAQGTQCLANLHNVGLAAQMYHNDYRGYFWPTVQFNYPNAGQRTYFWGTVGNPVNFRNSWLLTYVNNTPDVLWCPNLAWGDYVPQAGVTERTTEYGYNAWALDPPFWGRRDANNQAMRRKRISEIQRPSELFVMADTAMHWSPGGVPILQNSTSLDPVAFAHGPNTTATTHFRHRGHANALTVDGHVGAYAPAGGTTHPSHNIGFADTENAPHYDQ